MPMSQWQRRRIVHLAFSTAVVTLVLLGTYGPVQFAAVGWLGMLATVIGWFGYAVMEQHRFRLHK